MVTAFGFSVAQIRVTGSPGRTESGFTVNDSILAGGATLAGPFPARPAGACPEAGARRIAASRSEEDNGLRMCAIIPKREAVWIDDAS